MTGRCPSVASGRWTVGADPLPSARAKGTAGPVGRAGRPRRSRTSITSTAESTKTSVESPGVPQFEPRSTQFRPRSRYTGARCRPGGRHQPGSTAAETGSAHTASGGGRPAQGQPHWEDPVRLAPSCGWLPPASTMPGAVPSRVSSWFAMSCGVAPRRPSGPAAAAAAAASSTRTGPSSAHFNPSSAHFKMFTARDTTRATVSSDARDCSIISSFAVADSGMVSVGLNAVALVNDVYR